MTSFVGCRMERSRPGFQRHHIIPLAIVRKPHFRELFVQIRLAAFNPHDFVTNGMWLPATEELAIKHCLALHRGPHPQYSELVSDWMAQLVRSRSLHPEELQLLIQMLQNRLRDFLNVRPSHVHLHRNDPLRVRSGFRAIDDSIGKLWPDLPRN